jgi:DNA-nicking Smr family endonuclease
MVKKRVLSRGEIDLWAFVARQVKPLPGRLTPQEAQPSPPNRPSTQEHSTSKNPHIAPHRESAAPIHARPPSHPPLAPIERRLVQRVSRGQRPVDGALDLHGKRQAEAHRALLDFLGRMHRQGATLVLIVTGKGAADPEPFSEQERGVLRRLVPIWLSEPQIRRQILGFEEAPRHHGGSGALYVRLRKPRGD